MNKMQAIISAALVVSAGVGAAILKTDGYLWAASPSHAYGLVVFAVLDIGLAALAWKKIGLTLLGTILLGATQFLAMVGDILVGQPAGWPAGAWQHYLLGDSYFVALLGIQLVIVAGGLFGLALRGSLNFPPMGTSTRKQEPALRRE